MTRLNPVNIGMNKFCGPAVLSILTGKSTDECANVISSINGQYRVEGVQLIHLMQAASRLGFDNQSVNTGGSLYSTLTRIVKDDGIYVLTVAGQNQSQNHFVVIEVHDKKIYFCDNHTKEVMPAASSARLLQKVLSTHKVFKRREPVQIGSRITVEVNRFSKEIQVSTLRHLTYDMPMYDKTEYISIISLQNEKEYEEFVESIKGALNEVSNSL